MGLEVKRGLTVRIQGCFGCKVALQASMSDPVLEAHPGGAILPCNADNAIDLENPSRPSAPLGWWHYTAV